MDKQHSITTEQTETSAAELGNTGIFRRAASYLKNKLKLDSSHITVAAMSIFVAAVCLSVIVSPHTVAASVGTVSGYAAGSSDVYSSPISISQALSFNKTVEAETTGSVDKAELLWTIESDGEVIAVSRDKYVLISVLESFKAKYSGGKKSTVGFSSEVEVVRHFVNPSLIRSASDIREMLDPETGDETCRLAVVTDERVETVSEIPFTVSTVSDPNRYIGDNETISGGVPGEKMIVESIKYINGVEFSHKVIEETVLREPESEVQILGTKQHSIYDSHGEYIWPADGEITSVFGWRDFYLGDAFHRGLDIANDPYSNIYAADSGTVIRAAYHYSYGYYIKILHDNGDVTLYGHCNELYVDVGERVYQGEVIAAMGDSGEADGVHLHFEIRTGENEEAQDPLNYLSW